MCFDFDFVLVSVPVVPVVLMPKRSQEESAIVAQRASRKGRYGQRSEGRQRKYPHGFMRSRTLESFGLVYIRNYFIVFGTKEHGIINESSPQERRGHHERFFAVLAHPQPDP